MAMDKAILEHAAVYGIPTMRVYGWKPYCISLGYHQSTECVDLDRCRRNTIDVVRRPTGGRAVFHAEEVTYSVIIPRNHGFFSSNVSEVYNRISQGLCQGIQKLGIPAQLQKRSLDLRSHYRSSLSASCFSSAARNEVLVNGKKLIGSAQRNLSLGVLQHGSILMGEAHLNLPEYLTHVQKGEKRTMRSTIKEKTATIQDFLNKEITFEEVASAIRSGMMEMCQVKFEDRDLTKTETEKTVLLKNEFSILESTAESVSY
jgi:lipoate-protein ligase A